MEQKAQVWKRIKERSFNIPFQEEFFGLIEPRIERVEFVKDHIGLRDFLFIAEEGTNYVSRFFSAVDVDIRRENSYAENEIKFMESLCLDPEETLRQIKNFFEETNRTLGLGIGFLETRATDLQHLSVGIARMTGKIETFSEGFRSVRRFPQWFSDAAKMPEELIVLTREEERALEEERAKREAVSLMEEIDRLLEAPKIGKREKEEFRRLSSRLEELKAKFRELF